MRDSRFEIVPVAQAAANPKEELRRGLSSEPRSLPTWYFYDETGSKLFEAICNLPEYYLTRTENRLLKEWAGDIIEHCPSPVCLAELGSGSSSKTTHLIRAILQRQPSLTYYPIDVSRSALTTASESLLARYPNLRIVGLLGGYAAGLAELRKRNESPLLLAFLGSTIGNFDEDQLDAFFAVLRGFLHLQDLFLLGFDLLKSESLLLPAYNDARGVTAKFNLNLLARLNREYGADFDLSEFEHEAIFNKERGRIEMYLISRRDQTVHIPGLGLTLGFKAGERIHTENSYKFAPEQMRDALARRGLSVVAEYYDPDHLFAHFLVT